MEKIKKLKHIKFYYDQNFFLCIAGKASLNFCSETAIKENNFDLSF